MITLLLVSAILAMLLWTARSAWFAQDKTAPPSESVLSPSSSVSPEETPSASSVPPEPTSEPLFDTHGL